MCKVILILVSIFSFSIFAQENTPEFGEFFKSSPKSPFGGVYDMKENSVILLTPQANESANSPVPLYFHKKSNPKAVCNKYGFDNYVEGSVAITTASYNYDYIIVEAYEFTGNQLRFKIPPKDINSYSHLEQISEVSCY